jgi:DNA-binding transcriptional ArsR family regulator
LLAELLFSGKAELNLSELADRAGLSYGAVHREVGRLLEAGLLVERRVGGARLVQLNGESPLTGPVRDLLLVSAGPVPLLARELENIDGVESAFLYGSFAARMRGVTGAPPNDIDVMIVGSPDPLSVYEACRRVGDQVGRPINPTIMTIDEVKQNTGFLTHLRENPIVPVIGEFEWP